MLPFTQIITDNYRIRTFSKDVNEYELKWHQDEEDRIVGINTNYRDKE